MTTEFWNGNRAAAVAARQAKVQVVAAYPITPQTHTVEYLAQFVADGALEAHLVKVESEHSALSACCGAASVGARAFTASCSQGLQLMSEVMYFASGMRFPIVMAIANRTLSVPVNIWADHQDTLVNRDAGWVQLYAGSVQEVYDLILGAFRIAEEISLPALVAYDGFILSHASEPVRTWTDAEVDAYLPRPGATERPLLDPEKPLQFGEVLFPDYYPDFEYKKHRALADALPALERALEPFGHAAIDGHRCEDAEYVFLGLGSMMETARWTADRLRALGVKVGVARLRAFRPFPERAVTDAVRGAKVVCVLDRDIGYGTTGMVYPDVTRTLYHATERPRALNFIIGTGGKDVTPQTIERCLELARTDAGEQTVFWPDARGPQEGLPYTEGLEV
ncbi:MAG: pyruvate ferredoxin oxidoreductase [Planctomycetota bacterium]|jgi:pyruvate ferredoxin oxidoreductase alpha subunit